MSIKRTKKTLSKTAAPEDAILSVHKRCGLEQDAVDRSVAIGGADTYSLHLLAPAAIDHLVEGHAHPASKALCGSAHDTHMRKTRMQRRFAVTAKAQRELLRRYTAAVTQALAKSTATREALGELRNVIPVDAVNPVPGERSKR